MRQAKLHSARLHSTRFNEGIDGLIGDYIIDLIRVIIVQADATIGSYRENLPL